MVFAEDGAIVGLFARRLSTRGQYPAGLRPQRRVATPVPAMMVGARSTSDTGQSIDRPAGTSGPARMRGTAAALSYMTLLPQRP